MHPRLLGHLLVLTLAKAALAGCTSDPRYGSGVDRIEAQHAERQRLEAVGFPRFSGHN